MSSLNISDVDKARIWQQYRDGNPTRVPLNLCSNPRVVILNPAWNPHGHTFEQIATDPALHLRYSLLHQLYRHTVLGKYSDNPTTLPEVWTVELMVYNVYEAAYFGAPILYPQCDVPCSLPLPIGTDKHDVFDIDIENPMDHPRIKGWIAFHADMKRLAEGMKFEGRPVRVADCWWIGGTDGPLTGGCNLFGEDFLIDLIEDSDFAQKFLEFYTRAAIIRRAAFVKYWGPKDTMQNIMADDSCALISTNDYRDKVLRYHRMYMNTFPVSTGTNIDYRRMHMCGDATRHFPILVQELGITSFDTGFPVDFGKLRRDVGNNVEITGGTEANILLGSTSEQVYARTRDILNSGIKEGGRFILREANNLPPNVPETNLDAMYQACLDYGRY